MSTVWREHQCSKVLSRLKAVAAQWHSVTVQTSKAGAVIGEGAHGLVCRGGRGSCCFLGVSYNISSAQNAARSAAAWPAHQYTHIPTECLSLCFSLRGLGLAGRGWTRLDHDNHRDDEHSLMEEPRGRLVTSAGRRGLASCTIAGRKTIAVKVGIRACRSVTCRPRRLPLALKLYTD